MNLKKICYIYSYFLVAFVLDNSAIGSDKQEESFSLSQSPSILIPPRPKTPPELREEYFLEENTHHQPLFENTEKNWQELETNYPIAYYFLHAAAASYCITSDILDELSFAKEKDDIVNTARFRLHDGIALLIIVRFGIVVVCQPPRGGTHSCCLQL